jgi:NADH-quinone oxidoreductase subunit I
MTEPPMWPPPPRSRGVIALREENCTVCMICVRECPDWCIVIEGHAEHVPDPDGTPAPNRRPRSTSVLDRFAIDFALCMYCGICVDTCPFDALFWSPEYVYDAPGLTELTSEKPRLVDWLPTVPEPVALEDGAEPEAAQPRGRGRG